MSVIKTEQVSTEVSAASVRWNRIEELCLERGWTISQLAQESGVARGTLQQWRQKQVCQPRNDTLFKLAEAFGLPATSLRGESPGTQAEANAHPTSLSPPRAPARQSLHAHRSAFNRQSNWVIQEVCQISPELFEHWSEEQWEELFSTFGVGGELNEQGVREQAAAINQKQETIYQLHVLLDTHLADATRHVIESLYQSVRCDADDQASAES